MNTARKEHWNLHMSWSQKILLVKEREKESGGAGGWGRGERERRGRACLS